MVAKKKLAVILLIVLAASIGSVAAVYYGTNIISSLSSAGKTQMVLKVIAICWFEPLRFFVGL